MKSKKKLSKNWEMFVSIKNKESRIKSACICTLISSVIKKIQSNLKGDLGNTSFQLYKRKIFVLLLLTVRIQWEKNRMISAGTTQYSQGLTRG